MALVTTLSPDSAPPAIAAAVVQKSRAASAADRLAHGRFTLVDSLRGIAALLVAWHHIVWWGPFSETAETALPSFVLKIADNGMYGVQMFFVISGFVIAYSIRGARITPSFLGNFALRRSIRLDPPYWTAMVSVLLLHFFGTLTGLLPSPFDAPPQVQQVLAHLLYLQDIIGYENLSLGFWTLCIEVQFYLLLVIFTGIAQRLPGSDAERGASGANLLIMFLPLALASLFYFHLDRSYSPWVVRQFGMFFLGSLVWWTLEGRLPVWVLLAYCGAVLIRLYLEYHLGLTIALITGVMIYVAGLTGHLQNWGSQSWLQFLGRVSYSLYLVHYPVMHVVENAGLSLTGNSATSAVFWMVVSLVASIGAAQLLYVCVEAPSVRLAARFKQPSTRPVLETARS